MSHPTFYGIITYKAYKFKDDPMNVNITLNKLIHKGFKLDVVVKTLKLVFVGDI